MRIYIYSVPHFVIDNCIFTNCSGGFVIAIDESKVLIQESFITGNNATLDCAIVICNKSDLVFEKSVISTNYVNGSQYCVSRVDDYISYSAVVLSISSNLTIISSQLDCNNNFQTQ